MSWSIILSGHPKPTTGVIDCKGLSMGAAGFSGFTSREAAVAWILRYLDARIVDTAAELSLTEPTCFITPGDVLRPASRSMLSDTFWERVKSALREVPSETPLRLAETAADPLHDAPTDEEPLK